MTSRRRRGAAGITGRDVDPRDAAEIAAMAGKTRRLMETTNLFVEAASSFSAATTEAGKNVPVSGALAFRRSCLGALLSAAAMLSLPACRRRELGGLLKRFETAQARLDESRGDDGEALEDMADLLSDIVQSGGGGRDPDAGDGSAEGGDR